MSKPSFVSAGYLRSLIKNALQEDIGPGDITSLATLPSDYKTSAVLKVKEAGILAGMEVAKAVFSRVDPGLKFIPHLKDGDGIMPGKIAFTVKGKARSIITAERLVLNIMQRMSGIATLTRKYVAECEVTKAKVLDTRKTSPGLRVLEKWAVKIGGGNNHRMGLYDMVLIKDNHIDVNGGVEAVLEKAREYLRKKNRKVPIVLEVRNKEEIERALAIGIANRLLLDNFSPAELKKAVAFINKRVETEASGGINLKNIRKYAATGVDFISVGALTHSATSLDLSLKISR